MPNANTIIVENAERLGLSQLYQIRGRVGRSNKQAYAYITYKRNKLLSEVADKRLKAIKEFTEFGSGFKIAMRDLELLVHLKDVNIGLWGITDHLLKNVLWVQVFLERM